MYDAHFYLNHPDFVNIDPIDSMIVELELLKQENHFNYTTVTRKHDVTCMLSRNYLPNSLWTEIT